MNDLGRLLGIVFHHQVVTRFGNYIYWCRGRWLQVYDATDPENPIWVTRRDIGALCQSVMAYGTHLYLAAMEDVYYGSNPGGIYVFSLGNPANPVNVIGDPVSSNAAGDGVIFSFTVR